MGCPHCSASVAAVSYSLPFSEWVFIVATFPLPHHCVLFLESKSPWSATSRPPHQPEVLDFEWMQWLDGTVDCVPWGGCKCDPCLGGRVTIYGDQMGSIKAKTMLCVHQTHFLLFLGTQSSLPQSIGSFSWVLTKGIWAEIDVYIHHIQALPIKSTAQFSTFFLLLHCHLDVNS